MVTVIPDDLAEAVAEDWAEAVAEDAAEADLAGWVLAADPLLPQPARASRPIAPAAAGSAARRSRDRFRLVVVILIGSSKVTIWRGVSCGGRAG
jgi:hypothetical protein